MFNNKFLIPVGQDNEKYFTILDKYKKNIAGVYVGWPGAPSGRVDANPSCKFFDRIFRWCAHNDKIFDILFNMQAHDFVRGFNYRKLNLAPYKRGRTQLTFASVFLLQQNIFRGFDKILSVNHKVNSPEQLYFLKRELTDLTSFVLDRDCNRDLSLTTAMYRQAKRLGITMDIMINEGCIPFCPNKIDHNIFTTLAQYSDQKQYLRQCKEICYKNFRENLSGILKSPFLTREVLGDYKCRFFKVVGRRKPPLYIDNILDYYINGRPVDIGIVFTNMSIRTGITTEMLPPVFHRRIRNCRNECYRCNFCAKTEKRLSRVYTSNL